MAKNKEKTTESVDETPAQQMSQHNDVKDTLIKLVQILLPIIGIFAALSYFLGRLHIESYYYALGMNPHVLDFNPEDYMFSSFNLVIMCLTISFWLYMYWRWAKPGRRLVLGFPIDKGQKWPELLTDILWLIFLLGTFGALAWNIFASENYGSNAPGFMGFNAGFVIGIGAILYSTFTQWLIGSSKLNILKVVLISLLLLASIPTITNRLAEIEAKADIERFPQTMLICEDNLPSELQSSPSTPTKSSEVKLIITNNGMTYVLKQDDESTDEWQIYAIPEDGIKQIIYLHSE